MEIYQLSGQSCAIMAEVRSLNNLKQVKEWLRFGVMAGLISVFAVIFARSCEAAFTMFMYMFHHIHLWVLVVIPASFVSICYLIKNYFPEAEGSGIPQALALNYTNNIDRLSRFFIPKVILSKFVFVILGTLSGATIGREGPTVQIGATIMLIGNKNLTNRYKKILLVVGSAAGLAAAFNTPIGGIVFAFEELSKNASQKSVLPKVTGIAISGVVAVLMAGNYSYFGRVERSLLAYDQRIFLAAIVIGIFAALNCYVFTKIVYYLTLSPTSSINNWRKKNPYLNAILFGFMAAAIGIISSGLSFGNGYTESKAALNNHELLPQFYYIYKMLGSIFSTASGVPGGYFATSLAIGSGIGNFAYDIYGLFNIQQYCLLGMVAFLAALTRAPATAIVMVLQVTSSQIFTLPLIVAALTATWIAQSLGKSIYEYQIENYIK